MRKYHNKFASGERVRVVDSTPWLPGPREGQVGEVWDRVGCPGRPAYVVRWRIKFSDSERLETFCGIDLELVDEDSK